MQSGRRIFSKRKKRFRENWTFEYHSNEGLAIKIKETNIDMKTMKQTCLICAKGKRKEKGARTTISSVERLNIANNWLLPILTSLVTETPVESNVAAEELKEFCLLEKLQFPSRGTQHLPNLQTKQQKKT